MSALSAPEEGAGLSAAIDPSQSHAHATYYSRIAAYNLAPLWESLANLVTPEPVSRVRPAHWRYPEVRPLLLEGGEFISAAAAERRVLVLENPGLPGQSAITDTLYAGLQLILPGEVARSHRHAAAALRMVVEGEGAFTAVDGERATMRRGDFLITPSWSWHDHANPSSGPMIWLDGLDVPLVNSLAASFLEHPNWEQTAMSRPEGDSLARYGAGLLPVDWRPEQLSSPVFSYPYSRTREALAAISRAGDPDPCHGYKLRYSNPASGGDAMPTMGAYIQLLQESTTPCRCTDATVFFVIEGAGSSRIGDRTIDWNESDVFVAPSWVSTSHQPDGEAVIFSYSDRPTQQKLGLWREQRGTA